MWTGLARVPSTTDYRLMMFGININIVPRTMELNGSSATYVIQCRLKLVVNNAQKTRIGLSRTKRC